MLLLLVPGPALPAAGPVVGPGLRPDLVVVVDPLDRTAEGFGQVIIDAARYVTGAQGLLVTVLVNGIDGSGDPAALGAQTEARDAVVCRFCTEGNRLSVSLLWLDTRSGAETASIATSGMMDLHLDSVILAAFTELLDRKQDRVRSIIAARETIRRAAAEAAGARSILAQELAPAVAVRAVVPDEPAVSPGSPSPPERSPPKVLLTSGFAPFLPIGAAAYYFRTGYFPTVLAAIDLLRGGDGVLTLGVAVGLNYFKAAGPADSADNYLAPLGLDVRYGRETGVVRPFLHLAGGAALLTIVTGSQGTLLDFLPFARGGLGLELEVTPRLGIGVLVDYEVYFEMPYLLTGLSPSIVVVVRP